MGKTLKKRICFFALMLIVTSILTARFYLGKKPETEKRANITLVKAGEDLGAEHDKGTV